MVSKIENSEGLRNCEEIATASDVVMIDRGDLVAEIGYSELFSAIEKIAQVTKIHGKPLIMATENLETMVRRQMPSKSEVISLAHSAQIGVDCFMLSEETALSKNKHTTVSWLANFLKASSLERRIYQKPKTETVGALSIWSALRATEPRPVVVMSKSGRAIFELLSTVYLNDLFVLSNNVKVSKVCQLFSNNIKCILTEIDTSPTIEILWDSIDQNKDTIFDTSDDVIAIYVSKYTRSPRVNTISMLSINDFK